MLKIGIDVHGVLDTFPAFQKMVRVLATHPDVEIHIITGLTREDAEKEVGHLIDFTAITYFSIVEYLVSSNIPVEWRDGYPYANKEDWNSAKSIYCKQHDIDIMLDDSPTYGEFFKTIDTVFCQVQNTERVIYNVR